MREKEPNPKAGHTAAYSTAGQAPIPSFSFFLFF
jgi:hypothetical protein